MPINELTELLDTHGVRYVTIRHSPAFTAQEVAASAHIPGKELAKTVIVQVDGDMAMAVLPASHMVDLARLKDALGAKAVVLAEESAFRARFPNCELGAMPPFGNLYGLGVIVDPTLCGNGDIAFNAGSHKELVRMAYKDFEGLVGPTVISFAQ